MYIGCSKVRINPAHRSANIRINTFSHKQSEPFSGVMSGISTASSRLRYEMARSKRKCGSSFETELSIALDRSFSPVIP